MVQMVSEAVAIGCVASLNLTSRSAHQKTSSDKRMTRDAVERPRQKETKMSAEHKVPRRCRMLCVTLFVLALAPPVLEAKSHYSQTNLVSNVSGSALLPDSALVNSWGVA